MASSSSGSVSASRVRSGSYFVIVGHGDSPVFEKAFGPSGGPLEEEPTHFFMHAALDCVDQIMWTTNSMFLHRVDRLKDLSISGFCTASGARFLLLHNAKMEGDTIKAFFKDVYVLYLKALMNPLYDPKTPIQARSFDKKVSDLGRRLT